jgi:LssY C-terminus
MWNGVKPRHTLGPQARSLWFRRYFSLGAQVVLALAFFAANQAAAEVIQSGTALEIRLASSSGSRVSHVGDPVEGVLLSAVVIDGAVVVPAGSSVHGTVTSVVRYGLGFRHFAAGISYHFDRLRLKSGQEIPIDTVLSRVDTAREHVDDAGRVRALVAGADFSSTLALYAWKSAMWNPIAVGPATFYKMMFLRSPDPEIFFPAGTEMILRLTAPVFVEAPQTAGPPAPILTAQANHEVVNAVDSLPTQWIYRRSGRPSDLLNIAMVGSTGDIDRAFSAAGWSGTQPSCARSFWRTYRAVFERHGYAEAPMTTMLYTGRAPDLTYQKSLNTFVKRHHVRLWKTGEQIEGRDVWVGAATEDVGIHFNMRMHRFMHFIDSAIDNERTKVTGDLIFTGCVDGASLIARPGRLTQPFSHSRLNLNTDGNIAALRLGVCSEARTVPMALPAPPMAKRNAAVRTLVAIRNELVRANFVSLGVRALQLPQNAKSLLARRPAGSPRDELTEQQLSWMRSTGVVLKSEGTKPPVHSLLPGSGAEFGLRDDSTPRP